MVALLNVGLGGLFLAAGLFKVRNPVPGARAVAALVPGLAPAARNLTRLAGVGEVTLGALLCLRIGGAATVAVVPVVLLLFTGALVRLRVIGAGGSCGCFSEDGAPFPLPIVRNLVLLVAAAWLLAAYDGIAVAPSVGETVAAVVVTAALAVMYMSAAAVMKLLGTHE